MLVVRSVTELRAQCPLEIPHPRAYQEREHMSPWLS